MRDRKSLATREAEVLAERLERHKSHLTPEINCAIYPLLGAVDDLAISHMRPEQKLAEALDHINCARERVAKLLAEVVV